MCFTGGIDDLLHQIRAKCEEQKIPIVFALSRRGLGRAVLKKVPVSIVGVFNYDGAQVKLGFLFCSVFFCSVLFCSVFVLLICCDFNV
jgi:hypothetical protein